MNPLLNSYKKSEYTLEVRQVTFKYAHLTLVDDPFQLFLQTSTNDLLPQCPSLPNQVLELPKEIHEICWTLLYLSRTFVPSEFDKLPNPWKDAFIHRNLRFKSIINEKGSLSLANLQMNENLERVRINAIEKDLALNPSKWVKTLMTCFYTFREFSPFWKNSDIADLNLTVLGENAHQLPKTWFPPAFMTALEKYWMRDPLSLRESQMKAMDHLSRLFYYAIKRGVSLDPSLIQQLCRSLSHFKEGSHEKILLAMEIIHFDPENLLPPLLTAFEKQGPLLIQNLAIQSEFVLFLYFKSTKWIVLLSLAYLKSFRSFENLKYLDYLLPMLIYRRLTEQLGRQIGFFSKFLDFLKFENEDLSKYRELILELEKVTDDTSLSCTFS